MYISGLNFKDMHKVNYNLEKCDNININNYDSNKSIKVENNTFSMNYSSKSVSSIMKSINNCFESDGSLMNTYYHDKKGDHLFNRLDDNTELTNADVKSVSKVDDTKSDMANLTSDYGEILKKINSDDDLSKDDKDKLIKILDTSFDNYSDNLSQALSDKISGFLNYAADNKDEVFKKCGIKINAEKIVDSDELKKNIRNMFSAAKIFYKNNPQGSDEELNAFIDSKFKDTKSIDNISYKDLILAKNALANNKFEPGNKDEHFDKINKRVDDLIDKGASDTLVNNFEKAYGQNADFELRSKAYANLRKGFEDTIKKLEQRAEGLKKTLENLSKEAQEADKEYQYSLRDMQEKKMKARMLLNMLPDGYDDKAIENLKKDHDRTLKNISKQQAKIQRKISDVLKQVKDKGEVYKDFIQDPNQYIDDHIRNDNEAFDENIKNNKEASDENVKNNNEALDQDTKNSSQASK